MDLQDKSRAGMIDATKETYHLMTSILTFVSHLEHSNGCHVQNVLTIYATACRYVAIFLQVHTIKSQVTIKWLESNRKASFSFARNDVFRLDRFLSGA